MISNENNLIPQKIKSTRLSLPYQAWRIKVCEFARLIIWVRRFSVLSVFLWRIFGFQSNFERFSGS